LVQLGLKLNQTNHKLTNMKKIFLIASTAIILIACNSKQNETTSNTDDAAMADFKENSKVILAGFEAFTKNDTTTFKDNMSDTAKINGAAYGGEAIVGKAVYTQRLVGLHKIFTNIKANDIKLLPGVDEVTFRPNGEVRAYVRMTDDAIANGAKIEHKFYGVYQFNKDHKITNVDEYMDISGAIIAATTPKKS
jgi:cellulase/cellobiase CelA1